MLQLVEHHLAASALAAVTQHSPAEIAALMLRVSLGTLFIAHLYWKLAIAEGGFRRWWANFETNGYHWLVPYYVVSAETLGAVLLIPGIHTRWVCLYALPLMIGATHFWYVRKGFFFTTAGCEFPLVWAVMLALQALLGDGAFAVGGYGCHEPFSNEPDHG